jgi:hypothetical protein
MAANRVITLMPGGVLAAITQVLQSGQQAPPVESLFANGFE